MNSDHSRAADFDRRPDDPAAPVPMQLLTDANGDVVGLQLLSDVPLLAEFDDVAIPNPRFTPPADN